MEIVQRNHYFYSIDSNYMPVGWHWLTPLDEFRQKFFKDDADPYGNVESYRLESRARLEILLADMMHIMSSNAWIDKDTPSGYVFFIPDGFSPKFGVIWVGIYGMVIVSPFPLENIARTIEKEYLPPGAEWPNIELVPDHSRMQGPVLLPLGDEYE